MASSVLLHLSLIAGVGPVLIQRLIKEYGSSLERVYEWTISDWVHNLHVTERQARTLVTGLRDRQLVDAELALIEKHHVSWVTPLDDEYPALLRELYAPPTVLYYQGAAPHAYEKTVAIVGSRKANRYGQRIIDAMVADFVSAGWVVVSGGALGADAMAHQATVNAGGITCAVIGAGLLQPYPNSNRRLFRSIVDCGGTVASPFPLAMNALPGNFPARNRIISGLSQATVVVQAAEKSGARITALFALEQGREVCAVPGPVDDPLSAGCHKLIKEGAALVTSAADVLHACGHTTDTVVQPLVKDEEDVDPLVGLCSTARTFDELLGLSSYEFAELQERLLDLQLSGDVTQDYLGRWQSIR